MVKFSRSTSGRTKERLQFSKILVQDHMSSAWKHFNPDDTIEQVMGNTDQKEDFRSPSLDSFRNVGRDYSE